jgi:hypothetical protein
MSPLWKPQGILPKWYSLARDSGAQGVQFSWKLNH